jgi:multiple sugar transport system permease protein
LALPAEGRGYGTGRRAGTLISCLRFGFDFSSTPNYPAIVKTYERRPYLRLLILILLGCSMALPFCWMVMTSLKPLSDVEKGAFVPSTWDTRSYPAVLGLASPGDGRQAPPDLHFGKWYFNSLFVAGWVTFLQLLTSSMAAYAFSRIPWSGRDKVFLLYLGTLMVPTLILIIPNYFVMFKLHLVNTYLGLILPASFTAFGTFLMRQFMMSIPPALDEAAEMDGASRFQIFSHIILPLSKPGLITLAIFCFIGNYGSFFWPLVMIKDEWLWTLPIGMLYFNNAYSQQTNLLMAATLMNLVPPILVFIALQKFLVRGIQLGAVKIND